MLDVPIDELEKIVVVGWIVAKRKESGCCRRDVLSFKGTMDPTLHRFDRVELLEVRAYAVAFQSRNAGTTASLRFSGHRSPPLSPETTSRCRVSSG